MSYSNILEKESLALIMTVWKSTSKLADNLFSTVVSMGQLTTAGEILSDADDQTMAQ